MKGKGPEGVTAGGDKGRKGGPCGPETGEAPEAEGQGGEKGRPPVLFAGHYGKNEKGGGAGKGQAPRRRDPGEDRSRTGRPDRPTMDHFIYDTLGTERQECGEQPGGVLSDCGPGSSSDNVRPGSGSREKGNSGVADRKTAEHADQRREPRFAQSSRDERLEAGGSMRRSASAGDLGR